MEIRNRKDVAEWMAGYPPGPLVEPSDLPQMVTEIRVNGERVPEGRAGTAAAWRRPGGRR
jgi:hypothetical protein